MDDPKDDIKSIVDEIVTFDDDTSEKIVVPEEAEEKHDDPPSDLNDTEEDHADTEADYDDADEPLEPDEYDDGEYDDGGYDFEYDEIYDDDDRLVVPMLKPILLWLIPLFAVILVIIWGVTTTNSMVEGYRKNFAANLSHIAENFGIKTEKEEVPEVYTDGLMEYKESSRGNSSDESGQQYRTEVESDEMITFDGASNAQFARYRSGVICAATNYICYINKNGKREWEKNIVIADPILRTEGDYFLVAQRGGNRFTLYKGESVVFDTSSEGAIHTGNVSSSGDVVLVTDRTGYKGEVVVYNRRGDKAFSWSSGSAQIISADISPSSRRVAAALLNTDDAAKSYVYMFNMQKTESYAQQAFSGTMIYKVDFKDNILNVFADNAMIGIKASGEVEYKIDYGSSEVTRASLADNGDKLMLFTGTNIPMMNIYNKHGKLKQTISSQKVPGFAYIMDGNIIYNVDREIILGKINAEIPYKYTAVMDIKGIVPVDKRGFLVIYSNSISMVRMRGVLW